MKIICAWVCQHPSCLCSIMCISAQQDLRVPVVLGYLQNAARHRQDVGGNRWEKRRGKGQVRGVRVPQEGNVRERDKQVMWSVTLRQVAEDEWRAASEARGLSPARSRWRGRVVSQGRQLWALSFARTSQKWGLHSPVCYGTPKIACRLWIKWERPV